MADLPDLEEISAEQLEAVLQRAKEEQWENLAILGPQEYVEEKRKYWPESWQAFPHVFKLKTAIENIPQNCASLTQLTSLILNGHQIDNEGAKTIGKSLSRLRYLELARNQLTQLPGEITQLTKLTLLYLNDNQLTQLPGEIAQLTKLTSLSLSFNQLTQLPGEIAQLTKLTWLNLSSNQLTQLPGEIAKLTKLTSLYLYDNQLTQLPGEIAQLTKLTSLNLSANQLSQLPGEITQLTNLTRLDLRNNQLTQLSGEIAQLTKLTSLDLSFNQLSELPGEIGQLTKLTLLDLRDNQLQAMPREILSLGLWIRWAFDLKSGIYLKGNPLQSPPAEIVKQGDAAVRAYFADLAETFPLREIKLLLIGDGGAGKTSLVNLIRGKTFDPHEGQTHGINICPWTMLHPDGDAIKVNIWDFGGQEIMHATHQFFLSHRSFYLLLLDGRREEKTEYWLKHIESFGKDSPVLVILNKIDENPAFEVNRVALQKKYPNIRGFFRISCATGEGIAALQAAMETELPKVEMLKTLWPKPWFEIKERLENKNAPFLDYEAYKTLCLGQGIREEDTREVLVKFLHDLGVVIHFSDLDLLNTYVLDPLWVTAAVYRIINNPGIVHENGVLALKDLRSILKKKKTSDFHYAVAKHPYIISIMKKFELCYQMPSNRVLIPDLLPVQEPPFHFEEVDLLHCRIKYEFLPRTVIPRFIVKLNTYIEDCLQWRTGVVLRSDNHKARAVIRGDNEENFIEIQVSGPLRRDFFNVIRAALNEINQGFENHKIRETIACNCLTCRSATSPYFHDYIKLLKFFAKGYRDYPCELSEDMVPIAQLLGDVLGTQEKDLNTIIQLLQELKEKQDTPDSLYKKAEKLATFASITGLPLMELIKLMFKI